MHGALAGVPSVTCLLFRRQMFVTWQCRTLGSGLRSMTKRKTAGVATWSSRNLANSDHATPVLVDVQIPATWQRLLRSLQTRGLAACLLPFSERLLGPHVRCRVVREVMQKNSIPDICEDKTRSEGAVGWNEVRQGYPNSLAEV